MNRQRFLASLGVLLVIPRIAKAAWVEKMTTVPTVMFNVESLHVYPDYPSGDGYIKEMPLHIVDIGFAPGDSVCKTCGKRYDQHYQNDTHKVFAVCDFKADVGQFDQYAQKLPSGTLKL
jgi:hypothetical protein